MYTQRLAAGLMVVAVAMLHMSKSAIAAPIDGSDRDTGTQSGKQQTQTELPPFDQKGTSILSQLQSNLNSLVDYLRQTHEQLIEQHSRDSELLAQEKNVSLERAQIIDELQQKVSMEASKGALIRIKLESEDMKQDIAELFVEFDHVIGQGLFPPNNYETRPHEIIKLIHKRTNKFQKVLEAELDTVSNTIDKLKAKEKQASHQYELAKEALNKLKPESKQFRQYLADQFSHSGGFNRYYLSKNINKRTGEFNAVVREQLATALDNIAY